MKRGAFLGLALLAALALVPLGTDPYWLRLGTTMLMYGVLAMSWNFIGGMAGYPSFATAAFFGLGAYSGAVAQVSGVPMLLAWSLAAAVSAAFAASLGYALLRLRGHYFAIASLVVGEVLREVTNSSTGLTGGGMGLNLPIPHMASVAAQARFFYYAMLGVAAITFAAALWTLHSRLGFGLRCIKQKEAAADMLGVNVTLYKVAAFVLSAVFVGIAGAVYASWVYYIEPPDVYDVLYSIKPIVMALLGGAGTLFGPLIGAALFLALEELVWRNYISIHTGMLGLLIVLLVLFLPKGVLAGLSRKARAG
jgi:branched-chain amino acid transport system permease protein